MRICHVINTLSAGGAEKHLLKLSSAQREVGLDPRVIGLRSKTPGAGSLLAQFEDEGIKATGLGVDRRLDPRVLVTVPNAITRTKPTLVHSHLPRADFAASVFKARNPTIPWVTSVHDVHAKSWSARGLLPYWARRLRRADAIIAISHHVKAWLCREMGLSADKITVIHYGIEPSLQSPSARPRIQKGPGSVIGTIGRLEPRKGHDVLIRAMPRVLRHHPDACLKIVGQEIPGHREHLQALADKLGVSGSVDIIGFRSDIEGYLDELDVFAFASHSEGFGLVTLEAMRAGLPVVVTRSPPLTEIVDSPAVGATVLQNDASGFADAINTYLSDVDSARSVGAQAAARVASTFTIPQMVSKTQQVYERVLAS